MKVTWIVRYKKLHDDHLYRMYERNVLKEHCYTKYLVYTTCIYINELTWKSLCVNIVWCLVAVYLHFNKVSCVDIRSELNSRSVLKLLLFFK